MNLFSLVKSSSLEILFSKKLTTFIYLVAGILVIVNQASATLQFYNAYHHIHEFDVSVTGFYLITLCLFLPLWLVGGLMLRACLQRLRLNRWVKSAFTYADYTPYFSPAEAGLLVDFEYSNKEFVATLMYMHFKGWIRLTSSGENVRIAAVSHEAKGTPYEQTLLKSLKTVEDKAFSSLKDPELLNIAKSAHKTLIEQMTNNRFLARERIVSKPSKIIIKTLYAIAGVVGVANFLAVTLTYQSVASVNYPRYPVSPNQLYLLAFSALVVLAVVLSGLRPKFSQDPKDPHFTAWIEAAGFKLYLDKVFKDRLSPQFIQTQDTKTIRELSPYAIAFGIIPTDTPSIASLLSMSTKPS